MQTKKRKILLDLDGVLNTYIGNYDAEHIPHIKDGAIEFLQKLSENFEIKIFSVRDVNLVEKWVVENNIQIYINLYM